MSVAQRFGAAALVASSFVLSGCAYRHDPYDDHARPAKFIERDQHWRHDNDHDRDRHERFEERRDWH